MEHIKFVIIIALTILMIGSLSVCDTAGSSADLPVVSGLDGITSSLRQIGFTPDGMFDRAQTAEQTWQRQAGDCEDYAYLAAELLQQLGIEAHVLYIYCKPQYAKNPMANHAVCIFRDSELTGGQYWFYSNDILRKTSCDRIEDAVYQVRIKLWVDHWILYNSMMEEVARG